MPETLRPSANIAFNRMDISLQSAFTAAVLLPESFRGDAPSALELTSLSRHSIAQPA
jgi:hypothetical protein